ncbi:MAG: outer membrane protein transport protein [Neisseria sp.]|nr:outer membrane protein transport protein [Neisseria sp.]
MNTKIWLKPTLCFTLAALSQYAAASGYHFGTQSVGSQSTANSSAAEAADPSTLFYNGAGLTKLDGTQATVNINLVKPSVKYQNAKAYYADGTEITTNASNTGAGETSGKIASDVQAVPHLYASHKINENVAVGLGAFVPFGSGTEYSRDSVLRYNLNELGLQTLAVQPTVAFKVHPQHSFAVGLVAQHTEAELRQYANFGANLTAGLKAQTAALSQLGITTSAQANAALTQISTDITQLNAAIAQVAANNEDTSALQTQLTALTTRQQQLARGSAALSAIEQATANNTNGNGAADGYARVKGDDWGFGYTLSWLWDVNDAVRVGANYRSPVKHTLEGTSEWHLSDGLFNNAALGSALQSQIRAAGYVANENASVKITTPESLSVHGMWAVDDKWKVFGDATWTRHSRFNQANLYLGDAKTVATDVNGVNQSNQTILQPNWRNTWKVAVGVSYQWSKPLQLRAGVAYDQSPVKNASYRMTTLPDNDRIWLSLGAKYDFNANHSLNVAYSHLFIKNAKAEVNGYCGGSAATSVACVSSKTRGSADYRSRADILGLQYTYKF